MFRWFFKHTKEGLEVPDPTPSELALTSERPLTLAEQIARFVRDPGVVNAAVNAGLDTFDEADDFDTGDLEPQDFASPYEVDFEGSLMKPGVQTRMDEIKGGMVEEMPEGRWEKAKERLKPKARSLEAPKAPVAESGKVGA